MKNQAQNSASCLPRSAFAWRFAGNGAQTVLQIVVLLALARLLDPRAFGLVTAALTVTKLADMFWQLGLGEALVQRPDLQETHISTSFTASVLLGLYCALPLWYLTPKLAAWLQMPDLAPVLTALLWLLPLNSLGLVSEALLRREMRFRELAGIELCANLLGTGATGLALAWAGWGVYALVGAALVQALVKVAGLWWRQRPPAQLRLDGAALRELATFGGGMTLTRLFNYFALQGDNLVIGYGLGAEALGLYSRAYGLMNNCVALFAKVLEDVLFPALARMQDETARLQHAFRRSIETINLAVLPASVVLLVLAPELVSVLLGAQWSETVGPFRIFAAGILLRSGYKVSISLARARGAVYALAWRQAVYGALVLVLAWLGLRWGLAGAAWGVTLAMAANYLLLAQLSLRLLALNWREFAAWHITAVPWALCAGAVSWRAATGLRQAQAAPWLTLLVAGGTTLAALLALYAGLRYGRAVALRRVNREPSFTTH